MGVWRRSYGYIWFCTQIKNDNIVNKDPLAERYYNIIKEKVKEDYYWEQKAENFIKTSSYYDK